MGGGEERGQGRWEEEGDIRSEGGIQCAHMCVVTWEGRWPRNREVFFDDGRALGILCQVTASMLTARASTSPRPSPSVETMGSDMEIPSDIVDGILPPPPPPPPCRMAAMEVSSPNAR